MLMANPFRRSLQPRRKRRVFPLTIRLMPDAWLQGETRWADAMHLWYSVTRASFYQGGHHAAKNRHRADYESR